MYTSSSRGSKRKADKNVDADFTSCLALGEGKPAPPTKSRKPRNRLFRVSGLVTLVSSRRFPTQTTTVQQMADQPHPLGACSLVVWQCIAFATSFLLASQTTSVAAAASCMTTSYTTTKLSHSPMSQAPGKRGHSSSELCNVAGAHTRIGCDFTSCDMEVLMIEIIFIDSAPRSRSPTCRTRSCTKHET